MLGPHIFDPVCSGPAAADHRSAAAGPLHTGSKIWAPSGQDVPRANCGTPAGSTPRCKYPSSCYFDERGPRPGAVILFTANRSLIRGRYTL